MSPAEEPIPSLGGDSEPKEAPASSPEVKKAIDKIKAGQFAEANTILEAAIADAPDDAQAAFFHGVALEGVGDSESAANEYTRAIGLMPQLIEASQNLSALLLAAEKNEEALQVAQAGLEQAPKDPALLANKALALDMLESPQAIAAYQALMEVAPDDDANRFNYAVALFLGGKGEAAQSELDRISTSDLDLLADMERLHLELKSPQGCVAMWNRALQTSSSAEGLAHRARCKLMAKDKAGAQSDLEAAIAAEPGSSIAHFYLGKLLKKEGQAASARKHFEAAAQGDDDFAKAAQAEL